MKRFKKTLIIIGIVVLVFFLLSLKKIPSNITYGVSFSKFHSDELEIDWKEAYLAILNELGVRNFRFSAHWPNTEPEDDVFNFSELDFQMEKAKEKNASVIFAVGRRLPGWPECHDPDWIKDASWEEKKVKILEMIEVVVERYKGYENIAYWQVENEPFLTFFGRSHCGESDEEFLQEEIDLVKKLDPTRLVLITDSGEFGYWTQAQRRGDAFGTSMYLYVWSRKLGPIRYPITPAFFRIKQNLTKFILGKKPSIVIELSAEPWLLQPIIETPIEVLLDRMGLDKFKEVVKFASKTGFDTQYLWGAEWWYWMKMQDHPELWDEAKKLF